MQKTHKKAVKTLTELGWIRADEVVADLIAAGIIEPDEPTLQEEFAQAAKDWLDPLGDSSPEYIFNCAAGWSTQGWETVVGRSWQNNISANRAVFSALVILAKEAGVEL